jgi:hypothetical protein
LHPVGEGRARCPLDRLRLGADLDDPRRLAAADWNGLDTAIQIDEPLRSVIVVAGTAKDTPSVDRQPLPWLAESTRRDGRAPAYSSAPGGTIPCAQFQARSGSHRHATHETS